MAASYQAKDSAALNNQLKVQTLCVTLQDPALFVQNGAALEILVREVVVRVVCAIVIKDAAGTIAPVQQASISIVDSTAFTAGGDQSAVQLATTTLAAGDVVILKYVTAE